MSSLKKSIALACAASILGMGVAFAQTDPNAAAPPAAAPAATPAPDAGDAMMKKPMAKKHMKKKHMKKKQMM